MNIEKNIKTISNVLEDVEFCGNNSDRQKNKRWLLSIIGYPIRKKQIEILEHQEHKQLLEENDEKTGIEMLESLGIEIIKKV